jgi:hypothetical protein
MSCYDAVAKSGPLQLGTLRWRARLAHYNYPHGLFGLERGALEATMRATARVIGFLLAGLLGFWTDSASAQASRTWVSGTGDDNNPCSRIAACKTFAGAISKTAPGGEIDALDPGGFGAVTITKSITIDGGPGVASVLTGGTNGIIINAGANDVVTLRNLGVNGDGLGINGIQFLSVLALHIENCHVFGFTNNGLDIFASTASKIYVKNSTFTNNLAGVEVRSNGASNVSAALEWVAINGNTNVTGGTGQIHVTLSDSQTSGSNNGINAVSGPGAVTVVINRGAIVNNGTNDLQANGAAATVLVGLSTLSGNNVAANPINGGVINTYQNNEVGGNITTNGTFSGPVALQ